MNALSWISETATVHGKSTTYPYPAPLQLAFAVLEVLQRLVDPVARELQTGSRERLRPRRHIPLAKVFLHPVPTAWVPPCEVVRRAGGGGRAFVVGRVLGRAAEVALVQDLTTQRAQQPHELHMIRDLPCGEVHLDSFAIPVQNL